MFLVVALLAIFCWIGLAARRFDARTQWGIVAVAALLIAIDYARGIV